MIAVPESSNPFNPNSCSYVLTCVLGGFLVYGNGFWFVPSLLLDILVTILIFGPSLAWLQLALIRPASSASYLGAPAVGLAIAWYEYNRGNKVTKKDLRYWKYEFLVLRATHDRYSAGWSLAILKHDLHVGTKSKCITFLFGNFGQFIYFMGYFGTNTRMHTVPIWCICGLGQ